MITNNLISLFSIILYYAINFICKIHCDSDIVHDRDKRYVYFPYGGSYKVKSSF